MHRDPRTPTARPGELLQAHPARGNDRELRHREQAVQHDEEDDQEDFDEDHGEALSWR
jgi:hypothetical protein